MELILIGIAAIAVTTALALLIAAGYVAIRDVVDWLRRRRGF